MKSLNDPSTLGAKVSSLGATVGRPMRVILGGSTNQEPPQANIGLAGMRAPTSSAKPLTPNSPLIRPVKSPIGSDIQPATAAILPRPIKKLGTPEVSPSTEELTPEPMSEEITEEITEEVVTSQEQEQIVQETQDVATLRPITRTMIPQQQSSTNVAKLTPVRHMLEPTKKSRGAPPSKDLGKKQSDSED